MESGDSCIRVNVKIIATLVQNFKYVGAIQSLRFVNQMEKKKENNIVILRK